eukprot:360210_1
MSSRTKKKSAVTVDRSKALRFITQQAFWQIETNKSEEQMVLLQKEVNWALNCPDNDTYAREICSFIVNRHIKLLQQSIQAKTASNTKQTENITKHSQMQQNPQFYYDAKIKEFYAAVGISPRCRYSTTLSLLRDGSQVKRAKLSHSNTNTKTESAPSMLLNSTQLSFSQDPESLQELAQNLSSTFQEHFKRSHKSHTASNPSRYLSEKCFHESDSFLDTMALFDDEFTFTQFGDELQPKQEDTVGNKRSGSPLDGPMRKKRKLNLMDTDDDTQNDKQENDMDYNRNKRKRKLPSSEPQEHSVFKRQRHANHSNNLPSSMICDHLDDLSFHQLLAGLESKYMQSLQGQYNALQVKDKALKKAKSQLKKHNDETKRYMKQQKDKYNELKTKYDKVMHKLRVYEGQ